jgi:hypothetical protein
MSKKVEPKIEVCSPEEIRNKFGEDHENPAGSREGIGNISILVENVIAMVEFMNSEPMKKLEKENKDEFERIIIFKYQQDIPWHIMSLLFEDQNKYLPELIDMFEILLKVKSGKADCQTEFEKFGESKNEEYVYPKFGGRDNFYRMYNNQKY